jgi:hypothetical protein
MKTVAGKISSRKKLAVEWCSSVSLAGGSSCKRALVEADDEAMWIPGSDGGDKWQSGLATGKQGGG